MTCNLLYIYILSCNKKHTLRYYGHNVYLPSRAMDTATTIDKFISVVEIHCSIRDVCFSKNSVS